ncbi:MAG: NAD(P)H-binding protein [Myxococcota bacterium]
MSSAEEPRRVVMMGSTGAVGGHAAAGLAGLPEVARLTLLGRRPTEGVAGDGVEQHTVDALDPPTYAAHLEGHDAAVCTLGVGEPSKVDRDTFVRIDKQAVLDFARGCREAGVRHFELLSSVGTDAQSRSFYLRCKGELEDGLRALNFDRLSLFHPSMILTPHNRYGWTQGLTLRVWPWLNPLLMGPLRKFRGVPVATLGLSMAYNVALPGTGEEVLHWDDFARIVAERR